MIDPKILHETLDFDFTSGRMFWKHRSDASPQWNARYAGKEAFTCVTYGYRQGQIHGKRLLAHRVIYAAAHGTWPELIDHINQDRSDNSLSNLRRADKVINAHNSKNRLDNKSGQKGVNWWPRTSRWRAYININGKQKHLGFFDKFDDAVNARQTAFNAMGIC